MIIKRLSALDENELVSCIKCYQGVFAGEPWNEWKVCRVCSAHWGRELSPENHCGQTTEYFWPDATVRADLAEMAARPLDASLVAIENGEVIGFSLGYGIAVGELEKHLGIGTGIPSEETIAYQDDLGVAEQCRKRGIAKRLFAERLHLFRAQGLALGVVRTLAEPPSVTYGWYCRLGYQVVARYLDGRVIMVRSLQGL